MSERFAIGMIRAGAPRMTCVEAHCENERNGWVMVIDPMKHAGGARFIEQDSGRQYVKLESASSVEWIIGHGHERGITLTPELCSMLEGLPVGRLVYLFPPGQQCFKVHLDREVVFKHQRVEGAHVAATRVHVSPQDFTEHYNEEADRVNREYQRG